MSTKKEDKNIVAKIKEFWLKYEPKIVLIVGFILVAVLAFEAGILKGQGWSQSPMVIEKPASATQDQKPAKNASQTQNLAPETVQTVVPVSNTATSATSNSQQNCAFVGSKNSNKYYPPNYSYARNIKPANLVCFKDETEAKDRGYLPVNCK